MLIDMADLVLTEDGSVFSLVKSRRHDDFTIGLKAMARIVEAAAGES